jgi:hypothetical protein
MCKTRRTLASIIRFKWYAGKSTFLVASYRAKATGCFGGVPYKVKVSDIFRDIFIALITFPMDFTASLQNCILICPITGCVTWS